MMGTYTDEIVEFLGAEYVTRRDNGELNRDILEGLSQTIGEKFGEDFNIASLRAKLGGIEVAEDTMAYIKDTDAEKEILAARKGVVKKAPKETKLMKATEFLDRVGLSEDLAKDLSRVKVATLEALLSL